MNNKANNDNGQKDKKPKQCPEFKPEYYWAFCVLLLYKLGGMEVISQEMLEKFDINDMPEVLYDHDRKVWIMRLKKEHLPTIIKVPKKILRKRRKIIRN